METNNQYLISKNSSRNTQPESRLKDNHRPQRLAPFHGGESFFHFVQADGAGDHLVELELALAIPIGEQREVARGEAVAIPGDAEMAAQIKELLQGQIEGRARAGYADEDAGAGQVARPERLLQCLHLAHRFKGEVSAIAAGDLFDLGDGIDFLGIDGVGGAKLLGPFQLLRVNIDGDDGGRAAEPGALNDAVTHAAAAEDRRAASWFDAGGIERGADAGHHATADERHLGRRQRGIVGG